MFNPGTIKQNWTALKPKVRVVFPNLTEQNVQAINGDADLLVTKVREKYTTISRDEIFSKLAPYLPVEVGKTR